MSLSLSFRIISQIQLSTVHSFEILNPSWDDYLTLKPKQILTNTAKEQPNKNTGDIKTSLYGQKLKFSISFVILSLGLLSLFVAVDFSIKGKCRCHAGLPELHVAVTFYGVFLSLVAFFLIICRLY